MAWRSLWKMVVYVTTSSITTLTLKFVVVRAGKHLRLGYYLAWEVPISFIMVLVVGLLGERVEVDE